MKHDRDRVLIEECNLEQLKDAVKQWLEQHDVHADNLARVSELTLRAQLEGKYGIWYMRYITPNPKLIMLINLVHSYTPIYIKIY
jgi:hypothetical protein